MAQVPLLFGEAINVSPSLCWIFGESTARYVAFYGARSTAGRKLDSNKQ